MAQSAKATRKILRKGSKKAEPPRGSGPFPLFSRPAAALGAFCLHALQDAPPEVRSSFSLKLCDLCSIADVLLLPVARLCWTGYPWTVRIGRHLRFVWPTPYLYPSKIEKSQSNSTDNFSQFCENSIPTNSLKNHRTASAHAGALQQGWMKKAEKCSTHSTTVEHIPVSLTACVAGRLQFSHKSDA